MALRWRYKNWYIRLWHGGREHLLATGLTSKQEAKRIENSVRKALKTRNFGHLDDLERKLCQQVYALEGAIQLPVLQAVSPDLASEDGNVIDKDELTLWDGYGLMLNSPAIKANSNSDRHEDIFIRHVIPYFRPERLIKDIWVPEIEEFLANVSAKGYAGSTVNKCKAALSIMFRELLKHRAVDSSPVSLVGRVSEKDGERDVYVSYADFTAIVKRCPQWLQPILWFLYMSGARANEALALTPRHVNLKARIIQLRDHETKNRRPKRIPIHKKLLPILAPLIEGKPLDAPLFVSNRGLTARIDSTRKPWNKAIDEAIAELGLDPDLKHVTVKDIRHCAATNMERSGVPGDRREAILGHSTKGKSTQARYISIGNKELLKAINMTTFDHGKTEIYITRLALARKKKNPAVASTGFNSGSRPGRNS
ncbi:MAG: tyrosine-type recombinase/integrase [Desulfomonilaceae bacterium]